MRKKEFLEMVMTEIETIKERATENEVGQLNFSILDTSNSVFCIYGQMTGHCQSYRARVLYSKAFESISPGFRHGKITFSQIRKSRGDIFTPLEIYITLKNSKNEDVIKYLKGEIATLKL